MCIYLQKISKKYCLPTFKALMCPLQTARPFQRGRKIFDVWTDLHVLFAGEEHAHIEQRTWTTENAQIAYSLSAARACLSWMRSRLLIKNFLRTFATRARFSISPGMGESAFINGKVSRDDLRKSSHRFFHSIQRFASPPRYLAAKRMRRRARGVAYSILHTLLQQRRRQLKWILVPIWADIDNAPKHMCQKCGVAFERLSSNLYYTTFAL